MVKVHSDQGNAGQNDPEIPLLLVGLQTGTITREISLEAPQKTGNRSTCLGFFICTII